MHVSVRPDQTSRHQRNLAYTAAQLQNAHTRRDARPAKKTIGEGIQYGSPEALVGVFHGQCVPIRT
jgi:hypothetical protein